MLENQVDPSSSLMMTQPHHLQMHHRRHGHQDHRQEREKDRLFTDQQAIMCDA